MKRYLSAAIFILLILALSVSAQMWPLSEGTQEIQLSGSAEWGGPAGDTKELTLGYGYFTFEGLELGPRVSVVDMEDSTQYEVEAFSEYHFMAAENVAPYVGAAVGYYNNSAAENSAAGTLSLALGCKFFILEDIAIDTSLNYTVATADVFFSDDKYESERVSLEVGLRFFY